MKFQPIAFIKHLIKDDSMGIAAQTAFFLLLAFFPLMLFAASVLSELNLQSADWAQGLVPGSLIEFLSEAEMPEVTSPWLFLLLAWGASSAAWALMKGVSRAYTGKKLKSVLGRLMAVGFTVGFIIVMVLTLTLTALGKRTALLATGAAIFGLLFALYKWTPGSTAKSKRAAWISAFVTAAWLLISRLLEIYLKYFSKYTVLYGGVGIFIGLALWAYCVSLVVVAGAELEAGAYSLKKKGENNCEND